MKPPSSRRDMGNNQLRETSSLLEWNQNSHHNHYKSWVMQTATIKLKGHIVGEKASLVKSSKNDQIGLRSTNNQRVPTYGKSLSQL